MVTNHHQYSKQGRYDWQGKANDGSIACSGLLCAGGHENLGGNCPKTASNKKS